MSLRWGICSTGRICSDFCSAVKTLGEDEHRLVAVVSRTSEAANSFASTFGIQKTYCSYEEFARDPEIEVVYIGSSHTEHVRLSLMMLNAGKHVLCEKPLAESAAEVKMVNAVAKEKKLFFMEAVWSRCFPVYHKIQEEITSGTIGDVQMVFARFLIWNLDYRKVVEKQIRGGLLLDAGIYTVQFACFAYGEEPISVKAAGNVIHTGHDIDGCIILTFSKGQKACLMYSSTASPTTNCASIHGTKGSIEIEDHFWCPDDAKLASGKVSNKIPDGTVPYNFPNSGGLSYEADEVKACIRRGETEYPFYTHKDSEIVHSIMDEVANQIGRQLPYKERMS